MDRRRLKILFASVLLILIVLFIFAKFRLQQKTIKTILIWNSADRLEMGANFGIGRDAFVRNGCKVTECEIVRTRTTLPFHRYDAVLINMLFLFLTNLPEGEGFCRQANQRFVFVSQESPLTMWLDTLPEYNNYFNWTMSYKRNSDIHLLYGKVREKNSTTHTEEKLITRGKNYMASKTRSAVWMASHCTTNSFRENYVKELSRYIDVDIYGACGYGNLTCEREPSNWVSSPKCYDLLAEKYKFYLSFENSVCEDYVTEKFFEILARDLIPVVYGGANYSQLAPPHSFIDARQYSPRQLARLLHRLSSNETLYNEYFWWKELYQVDAGPEQMVRNGFCDLCQKLHEDPSPKTYEDLAPDWHWLSCSSIAPWMTGNETVEIHFLK